MAINAATVFSSGGRELIDLLSHCVMSINTDALFVYLVREYQLHPRAHSALALYDVFCDQNAPARISDLSLIPPKDLRLAQQIDVLRHNVQAAEAAMEALQKKSNTTNANGDSDSELNKAHGTEAGDAELECVDPDGSDPEHADPDGDGDSPLPSIPLPPRYLFDSVADRLAGGGSPKIVSLESYYDPARSPVENLPGGELTSVQRSFVDYVWQPRVRPYLVSSGFWRLSSIG